jgi:hypothetical protein
MVKILIEVEVRDVAQAAAIGRALNDGEIKALVTIVGALEPLAPATRAEIIRRFRVDTEWGRNLALVRKAWRDAGGEHE